MPWCDDCDRFYSPNTVNADGTCPTCGRALAKPGPADRALDEDQPEPKVPWHFWLLLATAAIYLGWRALQGVSWVVDHL
jgi:hypothetical protein